MVRAKKSRPSAASEAVVPTESDKAAELAAGYKGYIPQKNLDFARDVIGNERANAARGEAEAKDAAAAKAAGLHVDPLTAMNAAAFAQAQAEAAKEAKHDR